MAVEVNFDGLMGPTHHFAALAKGNLASERSLGRTASPKRCALQGLHKMELVRGLGVAQYLLPPLPRPDAALLRALGFGGPDDSVREIVAGFPTVDRELMAAYSAASMWTANAATVSPSADTRDGRVHVTPANLVSALHRSAETKFTRVLLAAALRGAERFAHHPPLPATSGCADEGAANHMRLCARHGEPGLEVFCFGRVGTATKHDHRRRIEPRQTREASRALVRHHQLQEGRFFELEQSREAVDAGVFHNDVIATANENVLLLHEQSFEAQPERLAELRAASLRLGIEPLVLEVARSELSLADAVETYLFNSSLVTDPAGAMHLVCPARVRDHAGASAVVARILADGQNPIAAVHYVDVEESLQGGGGPACLRLRVVLTDAERAAVDPRFELTEALGASLRQYVEAEYPDRLDEETLRDPDRVGETGRILAGLYELLGLSDLYEELASIAGLA